MKSYQYLLSPVATTSNKSPQIDHVILEGTIEFCFINICFLISLRKINFGLTLFENQLLNVYTVEFNSTDKSSAREVDFSQARTSVAASLS